MAKLDNNGDGAISIAEAKGTKLESRFAKLDANADGKITKEELAAARKGKGKGKGKRGRGHMANLDNNGDKMLSAAEVAGTKLADNFAAIDANADGQISREEMKAHHEARRAERFAKRDTDGNGSLSAAEVAGTKLETHFAKVDTDGDGELTPEELKAAHKGHKGHKGKRGKARGQAKRAPV